VKPVLLDLGVLELTSYGVSKVLAAVVAGVLLARELRRHGRDPEAAYGLVAAVAGGFVGAKLYYLLEHADNLSLRSFGGSGFTWFGGFVGGALATALAARRRAISFSLVAGIGGAAGFRLRSRSARLPVGGRWDLRHTHRPALGHELSERDGANLAGGSSHAAV